MEDLLKEDGTFPPYSEYIQNIILNAIFLSFPMHLVESVRVFQLCREISKTS